VLDLSQCEVARNGDWFGKMDFAEMLSLCSKVTVAQLLTRDDFSKRFKAESPIYLHECLYPLMQAWASVMIKADIELGGTEQLYSFMLARDLQRDQELPEQVSVMSPILVGLDGERRMGKSLGNYIGISESPYDMAKKFMQLPDSCMRMFFELLTETPLEEVDGILKGHPKEAKQLLAKSIITEYHDANAADEAVARWEREISSGGLPSDIPVVQVKSSDLTDGKIPAAALLKLTGLCNSASVSAMTAFLAFSSRSIDRMRAPALIRARSSMPLTGLVRKSSAPAFNPCATSVASLLEVRRMKYPYLSRDIVRKTLQNSGPDMPGIIQSLRIRSGLVCRHISSATCAFCASCTSYPHRRRDAEMIRRSRRLSSTTKIRWIEGTTPSPRVVF